MAFDEHISVRKGSYRYIRYKDGSDELYDQSQDPNEWKNLSADPKLATIKSKLNGLLPRPDEMSPAMPSLRGKKKNKKKNGKGDTSAELRNIPGRMFECSRVVQAFSNSLIKASLCKN